MNIMISPVYIKTKHSVAAAAASKENRRDDATHIIFIMRIDNRPFHLQATDEISNCFYCCVSREITTKANNRYKLTATNNATHSNFY